MGYRSSPISETKIERIEVRLPLVGHNTLIFFEGEITAISQVDAICWIENSHINVGDKLKVQVKPLQERGEAFHIECEVVKKNLSLESPEDRAGLYYVLKFFDIQDVGQKQIVKWLLAG